VNTQEIIKLIQSDNLMKFYKGRDWMALRLEALRRDNYECQVCKEKGRYRKADCVHHIKEVKQHPELALTLDNLQCLCNTCCIWQAKNVVNGNQKCCLPTILQFFNFAIKIPSFGY
jgi:5-methylcytosine-specific restriction enzyme A